MVPGAVAVSESRLWRFRPGHATARTDLWALKSRVLAREIPVRIGVSADRNLMHLGLRVAPGPEDWSRQSTRGFFMTIAEYAVRTSIPGAIRRRWG